MTEFDPISACEALMEGYDIMPMEEAASLGDIFVTVTGCNYVINEKHFEKMKDGAIMCNAGHFDVEIDLKALSRIATKQVEVRAGITGFTLSDGRQLNVLADGRLVNLAGGDGHPAEIMDMSFALQAQSALWLLDNKDTLETKVYEVPQEADSRVGERLLQARGLKLINYRINKSGISIVGKDEGPRD